MRQSVSPSPSNLQIIEASASGLDPEAVHQHEESGEVLVLDVHHVFEKYDLEAKTGQIRTRVVRHTDEWDGYGPMPSSVRTTLVEEFRHRVGDPIRTVEFINPAEENGCPDADEQG